MHRLCSAAVRLRRTGPDTVQVSLANTGSIAAEQTNMADAYSRSRRPVWSPTVLENASAVSPSGCCQSESHRREGVLRRKATATTSPSFRIQLGRPRSACRYASTPARAVLSSSSRKLTRRASASRSPRQATRTLSVSRARRGSAAAWRSPIRAIWSVAACIAATRLASLSATAPHPDTGATVLRIYVNGVRTLYGLMTSPF
ncbi:hypothetical protein EV147_3957 [Cupriavidus agavae]|uniref:Uncharacterized protein n=1 Tax=Cupriavidus agavae TaxID=1001822 RepID=A0A4Q7RPA8_9BURK|nr:hypothetical protein EV147_3957 [Cupriavidus agavae]